MTLLSIALALFLAVEPNAFAVGPGAKTFQTLMHDLKSGDAEARSYAAFQIGIEQGSEAKKAVGALISILRGDDFYAKPSAAMSLGRIGKDAEAAVPALVAATRSPDWLLRHQAVTALGKIQSPRADAFSVLLHALGDKNVNVRRAAVYALGSTGARRADAFLALEKALDDPELEIRGIAAMQLCGLLQAKATGVDPADRKRILMTLTTAAQRWREGADPGLQKVALYVVGQLDGDGPETFKTLKEGLSNPDANVAIGAPYNLEKYAARRLGQTNSNQPPEELAEIVQLLIGAMRSDSEQMRYTDVFPIGELATTIEQSRSREASKPLRDDLVSALVAALSDKAAQVRYNAARALGGMGPLSAPALPQLIAGLKGDPDDRVRQTCAWAIGGLGRDASAAAVPALLEALDHRDTFLTVPPAAAGALARLGNRDPRVVRVLNAALTDRFPPSKDEVLVSLDFVGEDVAPAVPAVVRFLDDPIVSRRQWSAKLLANAGPAAKPAAAALARALRDEDAYVRKNAALALGQLAPASPEPVNLIMKLLGDPDAQVRATAAWSIGRAGAAGRTAEAGLRAASRDADWHTRVSAVASLACLGAGIGDSKALLLEALQKDDWAKPTAMGALECATRMRDSGVVDILRSAATNQDPRIRARSAELLGSPNPLARTAVPDLKKMTQDTDANVRAAAEASLRKITAQDGGRTP